MLNVECFEFFPLRLVRGEGLRVGCLPSCHSILDVQCSILNFGFSLPLRLDQVGKARRAAPRPRPRAQRQATAPDAPPASQLSDSMLNVSSPIQRTPDSQSGAQRLGGHSNGRNNRLLSRQSPLLWPRTATLRILKTLPRKQWSFSHLAAVVRACNHCKS